MAPEPTAPQQPGLRLRPSVNLWLVALRFACLAGLLATSVRLSWWTPLLAGALGLSYRWSASRLAAVDLEDDSSNLKKRRWKNPLRGKPTSGSLTDLPEDRLLELRSAALSDAAEGDIDDADTADDCATLRAFQPIRQGTACAFARRARLWGGPAWRPRLSLEANATACVPRLRLFCRVCAELGLDGFVIRLPGERRCSDFRRFSVAVYRTLGTLAACNPAAGGGDCMAEPHRLHRTGWVFRFHGQTFFVTTFAPFYGPEDSRFGFGAADGFILLQPELSFAQHDLPPDTPDTNWGDDEDSVGRQTVRDRVRCAFRDAGQAYRIRDTAVYPMIEDIVMPPKSAGPANLPEAGRWWELGLAAEKECAD